MINDRYEVIDMSHRILFPMLFNLHAHLARCPCLQRGRLAAYGEVPGGVEPEIPRGARTVSHQAGKEMGARSRPAGFRRPRVCRRGEAVLRLAGLASGRAESSPRCNRDRRALHRHLRDLERHDPQGGVPGDADLCGRLLLCGCHAGEP